MKKIIVFIIVLNVLFMNVNFSDSKTIIRIKKSNSVEKNIFDVVLNSNIFSFNKEKGVKIPVLMYHHISDDISNNSIVTEKKFRDDMEKLKKNGYTSITLEELYEILTDTNKSFPKKPIVITIDDGYKSNYEYIYPILEDLEMKASISIIGSLIGKKKIKRNNRKIKEHFNNDEMKEMSESGIIDIQNHTYDLHSSNGKATFSGKKVNLGLLPFDNESYNEYKKRLKKDLMKNQKIISKSLKDEAEFIIFPYGVSTSDTDTIIKELGFKGSITIKPGIRVYKDLSDLYNIPRINISNDIDVIEEIKKYNNIKNINTK